MKNISTLINGTSVTYITLKSVLELPDGLRGCQESFLRLSCHMMPFSSDFEMATRRKNKLEAKMIQILGYAGVLNKVSHLGISKREQYSEQK